MADVEYKVMPGEGGSFLVMDEKGRNVSGGVDIRNYREAVRHAEDNAKGRGLTVSVVLAGSDTLEDQSDEELRYSPESLRFFDRIGQALADTMRKISLDLVKEDGRTLVTEADAVEATRQLFASLSAEVVDDDER